MNHYVIPPRGLGSSNCPPDRQPVGRKCVCRGGTREVGGRCVPWCPTGTRLVNGKCYQGGGPGPTMMMFHGAEDGFGDTGDDLLSAAEIGVSIISDPAFPRLIQLGLELKAFEQGPSGGIPGGQGMNLAATIPFFEGYIYYRKHPWTCALIGLGILGVPVLLGVAIGRSR